MRAIVWTTLIGVALLTILGLALIVKGNTWGLWIELLGLALGWAGSKWVKQLQGKK